MLSGLSFQLASGSNIRHKRNVNVQNIVTAHFLFHLTNGLQEGQALNITYSTTNFRNNKIGIILFAYKKYSFLDGIGNMGNNLHRTAQIITTALLIDNALINFTGGSIGVLR